MPTLRKTAIVKKKKSGRAIKPVVGRPLALPILPVDLAMEKEKDAIIKNILPAATTVEPPKQDNSPKVRIEMPMGKMKTIRKLEMGELANNPIVKTIGVAIVVSGLILAAYLGGLFRFFGERITTIFEKKEQVIVKTGLIIPETPAPSGANVKIMQTSVFETPVDAGNREFVFPDAIYTLKEAYEQTLARALQWAADAKLVSIKSFGAVSLAGRAEEWEIIFGSAKNKKARQYVIYADKTVSEKDMDAVMFGADVPQDWFDSDGAVKAVIGAAQNSQATIRAINFYFNPDDKQWSYAVSSSAGNVIIKVN
jgi:hypothetical protein